MYFFPHSVNQHSKKKKPEKIGINDPVPPERLYWKKLSMRTYTMMPCMTALMHLYLVRCNDSISTLHSAAKDCFFG